MSRDQFVPVARGVPFDNSTNGFVSDDTQAAIEEVNQSVITSASPGFDWSRSGSVPPGTVLLNGSVPSSISGRWVYINNAVIEEVFVSNENVDTFDLEFFYHDGGEINLTVLGSVSIVSARGGRFSVSWPVPTDKQLGCRLSSGSAKNILAGAELSGTN